MRTLHQWLVSAAIGAALWAAQGAAQAISAGSESDCARKATALIVALANGDKSASTADFDPTMKAALSARQLAAVWAATVGGNGALAKIDQPITTAASAGSPELAIVPMHFALANLDAVISCDASARIAGLHFVPASMPTATATATPTTTEAGFTTEADPVRSGAIELGATFYRPPSVSGRFPAVVLVGGSGPLDRDGSLGANKPLRDLATGLARKGIAVLTYDKRTYAFPGKPVANIDDEMVDDAVAAINNLTAREQVDSARVFVLGHSFGGTLAPRIAQRSGKVAGLILLAPALESLESAIIRQLHWLADRDGKIDDDEQTALTAIEAQAQRLAELKSGALVDGALPLGIPASYWKSLWDYDPIAVARGVDRPILALFAGRDYQVLAEATRQQLQTGLADGPPLRSRVYPLLGHTFMPMSEPPDPAMLLAPAHLSQTVIDDVANWILDPAAR